MPCLRHHPKYHTMAFEPPRRRLSPLREKYRFLILKEKSDFVFYIIFGAAFCPFKLFMTFSNFISNVSSKLLIILSTNFYLEPHLLVRFRCSERPCVHLIEHGHHLYGELRHHLDHIVAAILIALGAVH